MRLSSFLIPVLAFVVAGVVSAFAARATVTIVEDRSVMAVQENLADSGHSWASVIGDGLQIVLEGEAPSEAIRFRAMSAAGSVVDASRVIDNMSVVDTQAIAPPAFAIEILRNDSGVSLIGLIPATTDRDALNNQIATIAGDGVVTDLLETADYPVPEGWNISVDYALNALGRLPRSKISIGPGRVDITAISDSAAQKQQLESQLARLAPNDLRLGLTITAPRPVITPFTTRFTLDADGARFAACAADTQEAQQLIIAAAIDMGAEGRISCTLGLGVPTRSWGTAVDLAVRAVGALGGGTATFSDADVVLVANEGTDRDLFNQVAGELANALPAVFALEAVLLEPPVERPDGPQTFTATLSPEGEVQLRGLVADELMNVTLENYAMAQFGRSAVTMGTRITDDLPTGWSVRMLAGVEALGMLSNGSVVVSPEAVTVRGNTGNAEASTEISRLMIEKLGQSADFSVDVSYLEELDPVASLPTPEECVSTITSLTVDRKITFDPGSAQITAQGQNLVDEIAAILLECPEKQIEIAGYTDSQGRDQMNLELSQARANAVLDALRARRVPVGTFTAVGYGEAEPIADNGTADGREANRRIEFVLLTPEPLIEEPSGLEQVEAEAAEAIEAASEDADAETDAE